MLARWIVSVATVAVALGSVAGCKEKAPMPPSTTDTTLRSSYESMKEETGEAMEAAKDWLGQKKDEAVATLDVKMQEMKTAMGDLKQKADAKGDVAKAEYDQMSKEVESKMDVAKQKLAAAKDAGADQWDNLKGGVKDAMDEVDEAYKKLVAKFKSE